MITGTVYNVEILGYDYMDIAYIAMLDIAQKYDAYFIHAVLFANTS